MTTRSRLREKAQVLDDEPCRLVILVAESVAERVVAELIAVERECCPFFRLDWQPAGRCLTVGVGRADEAPALDAIRHALGVPTFGV